MGQAGPIRAAAFATRATSLTILSAVALVGFRRILSGAGQESVLSAPDTRQGRRTLGPLSHPWLAPGGHCQSCESRTLAHVSVARPGRPPSVVRTLVPSSFTRPRGPPSASHTPPVVSRVHRQLCEPFAHASVVPVGHRHDQPPSVVPSRPATISCANPQPRSRRSSQMALADPLRPGRCVPSAVSTSGWAIQAPFDGNLSILLFSAPQCLCVR